VSILFVEKGRFDVLDGAFVMVDEGGIRTHIPIGGLVCLMLEPGTRVSHAAVALASPGWHTPDLGRKAGVRLYAAGQPGGARADRLLLQARLALDDYARLRIVGKMYALRFEDEPPQRRSLGQLRGIEGVRARKPIGRSPSSARLQNRAAVANGHRAKKGVLLGAVFEIRIRL
jgi:CRISPR-associated protein Cas1